MQEGAYLNILKELAGRVASHPVSSVVPVKSGSGSTRRYYRLTSGSSSFIGTASDNLAENKTFFYLTEHFLGHGLPVPRIIARDLEGRCYLQQDLGSVSLYDAVSSGYQPEHEPLLQKALEMLVQFQVKALHGLDFSRCYPQAEFGTQAALWDLHYFKYMFLKLSGADMDEARLDQEFEQMLDRLFGNYLAGFMYRDFQSRNIMLHYDRLWFIDYQGGRRGPLAYDVASLLYQSRIALPEEVRDRLTGCYIRALQEYLPVNPEEFTRQVKGFAMHRLLQTLGAYGYRGLFERKEAFLKPIVPALENVLSLMMAAPARTRPEYLVSLLEKALRVFKKPHDEGTGFTLTINSFSYMHGLPQDETGNGGGFVFDCRALPNPHRDEKLRPFTGQHQVIREWLGSRHEVTAFLDHCEALVMESVRNYLERGFTHLQASFGCTGGKHRSVYCAEELASRVKRKKTNLRIRTGHIELGIIKKPEDLLQNSEI